jgi:glycosyltransferase involved in cell wall biosynthesis/O-antigen/teichoic acid export membrane protein
MGLLRMRRAGASARAALTGSGLREFWRQTALLLVVLAAVNASNYLFHLVVSRMVGPSEYGALAALLAVMLVLSVPLGVLQTAIADRTATLRAEGRTAEVSPLALSALKTTTGFAWLAGFLFALIGAPLLSLFLRVDLLSSLLLAPYVVVSVPVSVVQGVLQGEQRFRGLAGLQLATTLLRLLLGVGLVWAGLGVTGAVLATVLATGLMVPASFTVLGISRLDWTEARTTLASLRGDVAPALYGLTSFWLLAEVDIALARHYLDGDSSGFYSSAGLIARALLFLPAAVGTVAFPRFVASRGDGEAQLHWLRTSVGAVGALAAVGFVGMFALRDPLVSVAFGERYLPAADLLPILALAMGWLAVVSVLVFFHIALGSRAYLISLAGVALEAVAIGVFHEDAEQVALAVAVTAALVAFFQYQAAASICRWQPRRQPDELPADDEPGLDLSVVLPCHNAAGGLGRVLDELLEQLEPAGSFEIIVVSDGSTDETPEIARSLETHGVRVLEYPLRQGKGHALQVGLREARGRYVAFCDSDGDIAVDAMQAFLKLVELYDPDVIVGSKRHPLSDVYYPPLRRLLSWTYQKLTWLLFGVNVRDTQTGFKLIRRDVLAAVLPRLFEKRYAFDLEFLVAARRVGFKRVFEAPVKIEYRFASQVNVRATLGIFVDTLAIFYRNYILNSYRPLREPASNELDAHQPVAAVTGSRRSRASDRTSVLFVNWRDISNPDAGGAETFTHEVARRWAEAGHHVSLLASSYPGAPPSEEIDGVRVRRIGRLRTGSFHAHVQREFARVHGVDVVVESVNTIPFLTPFWRRRLPASLAVFHQLADDVWDAEVPRALAPAGRKVERSLLSAYRAVPVVAVSDSTRRDLERLGFEQVAVVPNGRDEPPDVSSIVKQPRPTFLFVGRLAANKRPDHALLAFAEIRRTLSDAQLWIVGSGPLANTLAGSLPDGAQMLGRVPRRELYERMAAAHCLLVPSVREGWGLVVIEANSVGTPAVGYDIAGVRDSIRDEQTGLLADAGDPRSLARSAVELVGDETAYRRFAAEARSWAATFSWDRTAAELWQQVERVRGVEQAPPRALVGVGVAE